MIILSDLTIICFLINLINGQSIFPKDDSISNPVIQQSSNGPADQQPGLPAKTTSFNNNNKNKPDLLDLNQPYIDIDSINKRQETNEPTNQGESKDQGVNKELTVQKQLINDPKDGAGEYKSLADILKLAGLDKIESLVHSSDPNSFMIKTRTKTTSETKEKTEEKDDDEDEDEDDEDEEEKEVKTTKKTKKTSTKKKSTKKSTKKSSKKSKKKSKKSKKKSKKKKKCCCCCCC